MSFLPRALTIAALAGVAALAAGAAPAAATTITIVNGDAAGEGFNDPTPVSPRPGNPAATLGAQRLAAFQAAADYWEKVIVSPVTIKIEAQMNPMTPCNSVGGILGSAGPKYLAANFPNAPLAETYYSIAQADSHAGSNLSGYNDISAQFNTRVDGDPLCFTSFEWWYGIGTPAPAGTFDFFTTVLHEIGHGLGFLTFVDISTGAKCCGINPRNDVFMRKLEDHSTGKLWSAMTNAERVASAKDSGDLHWTGSHAVGLGGGLISGTGTGGHLQMFAPTTLVLGSSVSHWNTAMSPNELMEPYLNANARSFLSYGLLRDLGWKVKMIFADDFEVGNDDAWSAAAP